MVKAHRVEAGVRYCQSCYSKEFKRLLCGGCGMFKRLLASADSPRCQPCVVAQPCVRCRKTGRPVGVMTPTGPACNACRTYFVALQPCEICGTTSRRLSAHATEEGLKKACPRCAREGHHTCVACRRHRPCVQDGDGAWRCKSCIEQGLVPCGACFQSMPAGYGKRCQACYWRARCEHQASQLVELMTRHNVRNAFLEFVAWLLKEERGMQRRTRRLREQAEFFVALDRLDDQRWTGQFLLEHFGTAALRRYELPVRWLKECRGAALSNEDKSREADLRRIREAVASLAPNTVARRVAEGFGARLLERCKAESLSARSARLAMRPAIALLQEEDPCGARLPGQSALDRYLARVPGQRAAISTFLGHLNSQHDLDLRLPPKHAPDSAAARRGLEKQIAALVLRQGRHGDLLGRWVPLALRYFHRLSASEAKAVAAGSAVVEGNNAGLEVHWEGRVYWLPSHPSTM